MTDTGSISVALKVQGSDSGGQWVELIPPGPDVIGRDGRRWTMADAHAVIAATSAANRPLAVDWEHASVTRASEGLEAPASGWIEGFEVRAGSIWGRIDWTPRAKEQVANREYRFISPTFIFDGVTKAIKRLTGAGLTNNPNLEMTALNKGHGWRLVKDSAATDPAYPEDVVKIVRAFGMHEAQIMPVGKI